MTDIERELLKESRDTLVRSLKWLAKVAGDHDGQDNGISLRASREGERVADLIQRICVVL